MKQSEYKIPHSSIDHLNNTMIFKQIPNAKGNPDIWYSDDSEVCVAAFQVMKCEMNPHWT